jgi:putative transposase
MPGRKIPIRNGYTYHIINRGLTEQKIFQDHDDFSRAIQAIAYYQNQPLPIRFSQFLRLLPSEKAKILKEAKKEESPIEVISFCLMPTHFHFAIKQLANNGIAQFMANFSNSLTRYLNVKRERRGPILMGSYNNILVKNDEQLLHLTRYHHLQPYSAGINKTLEELEIYPYSSFPEYLGQSDNNICNTEVVMSFFKNHQEYRAFVLDRAEYQRELEIIKHLLP